jgi:flagellar basal-body rod protein FlgB
VPAIERDILATVENAMRQRAARQGVLAANVANQDTPGYKRADLEFVDALASATGLARTDARHITGSGDGPAGTKRVVDTSSTRPDGNNVNPDRELVLLSRNAGSFVQQSEVLSRLLALRRTAVTGGR